MTDPSVACLPVRSPDELRALASVAEAVFPSPRRPAGWFERKLEREGVRPELSVVAVDAGSIQGYLLLGTAPSEPDTARGAGVGLCPAYRGRGIGPRLMKVAANLAREAGLSRLEFLAEPARLPWYTRQGFTVVREELTLLAAPARPDDPVVDWQPATEPDSPGHPSWSWIPAFWQRTPADQRRLLQAEWHGLAVPRGLGLAGAAPRERRAPRRSRRRRSGPGRRHSPQHRS